jgi:hypothetical protein
MCRNIPKLLMAPAEAIAAAKKKATYGDALGTLIVDGIVFAVAAAIFIAQLGSTAGLGSMLGQGIGVATVSVFVLTFIGGLFFALLAKLVVNTLGGKGEYLHGLTVTSYSIAAPAVTMLITAIFFTVQWIGPLVGFLAISIGFALGFATFYRSIKELFATDMITALVAVGILTLVLTVAFAFIAPMLGLSGLVGLKVA